MTNNKFGRAVIQRGRSLRLEGRVTPATYGMQLTSTFGSSATLISANDKIHVQWPDGSLGSYLPHQFGLEWTS